MTKHLITALFLAVAAALAAAVMVVWMPTTAGKVVTVAALAAWIGIYLGKHRHARRGLEAMAAGLAVALVLVIVMAAAVPFVVFLAMTAPSAAHYLNPHRARVVRTTRGVRTPGAKAAGGRKGRPGEKLPARPAPRPRAKPAPTPVTPAEALAAALAAIGPPQSRSWPHRDPGVSRTTFLPWAGEDAGPSTPKPLRADTRRPSRLHRSICTLCLDGDCASCKDRGCECPNSHPLRTAADLDKPPY